MVPGKAQSRKLNENEVEENLSSAGLFPIWDRKFKGDHPEDIIAYFIGKRQFSHASACTAQILEIARKAHRGQKLKWQLGQPYIKHAIETRLILELFGIEDPLTLDAALLHDVLEETRGPKRERLRRHIAALTNGNDDQYGQKLLAIIDELTLPDWVKGGEVKFFYQTVLACNANNGRAQLNKLLEGLSEDSYQIVKNNWSDVEAAFKHTLSKEARLVKVADKLNNCGDILHYGVHAKPDKLLKKNRFIPYLEHSLKLIKLLLPSGDQYALRRGAARVMWTILPIIKAFKKNPEHYQLAANQNRKRVIEYRFASPVRIAASMATLKMGTVQAKARLNKARRKPRGDYGKKLARGIKFVLPNGRQSVKIATVDLPKIAKRVKAEKVRAERGSR